MARLLFKRYILPTPVATAVLIGCVGFLAAALGLEALAAAILLPGLILAYPLLYLFANSTANSTVAVFLATLSVGLPILAWWLLILGAVRIRNRWRLRTPHPGI